MPLFSSDRRLDGDGETVRWRFVAVFVVVVCLATGFLVWLGYVATREWQRGAELLLHRRQAQAMTLVSAALSRDMEGTWTRIIVPINQSMLEEDPPYDLLEQTARAFARFPYPESFIFWRADGRENGVTYVFNRAERQPPWDNSHATDDPFPVVMLRDPLPLRDVVAAARQQAKASSRFIVLELDIAGVSYQVVAHLLFTSTKPPRPFRVRCVYSECALGPTRIFRTVAAASLENRRQRRHPIVCGNGRPGDARDDDRPGADSTR